MRVIKKINKKADAEYIINEIGEIFEIRKSIKLIDKIEKKENKHYEIRHDGSIVEYDLVRIKLSEYDPNKVKELIKQNKKIIVEPDENATLKELVNIEESKIKQQVVGKKIEDVKLTYTNNGSRVFVFLLDNGTKISIKEGLLAGSRIVEIE